MILLGVNFESRKTLSYLLSKNDMEGYITAKELKQKIKNDTSDERKPQVVYIYSVVDDQGINYPLKNGVILYIGEASPKGKGIEDRFYHINSEKTKEEGNNTKSNYTLSSYYHKGFRMKLDIYILDNAVDRKELEDKLTRRHLIIYGALPIATSAGGGRHTPKELQILIDNTPLSSE